jgi:hypothetical protein
MQKSESIAKLATALVAAQSQFAPVVKKETASIQKRNGGNFSYTYADLSAVIAATRPALLANGLAIMQFPCADAGKVSVTTILTHVSGEYIGETLVMPVQIDSPQSVGSAITYGRRYAMLAALGIAAEDDDGAAASKPKPAAKEQKPATEPTKTEPTEPPGYGDWRLKMRLESRKGMPALRSLWNASPAQYRNHAMTTDSAWWSETKASVSTGKEVAA